MGDRLQNRSPYAIGPLPCPVCPVCNVGVLWPNCWTDQDGTWHACRPRPGHIALGGDLAPPSPKGHSPQFSAHICCGQIAAWIKMPLGMELGLGLGDSILGGDPALPFQKRGGGAEPPPTKNFGACLLWPNGWMDQDGTWHGDRPQPRRLCVRWGPSPSPQKGAKPPSPIFSPFLLWPNSLMHQDATWYGCRPQPSGLYVRWRPSTASPQRGWSPLPNFRPMLIVAKWLDRSRCHLARR